MTSLLTVIGKDRPGIIARVTGVLFRFGCNLEDISMTILEGEFAMMLIFVMKSRRQKETILKALTPLEKAWRMSFFWKNLPRKLKRGEVHPKKTESFIVTAIGKDQTGIVHKVSRALSGFHLNITDLNSRILGHGRKVLYAMALEVDIPKDFSLEALDRALEKLRRKLQIEIKIRPVERLEF